MALQAQKDTAGTLADVIDRILDKGLVINADIAVSVVGVELLGIKIRAALASFETAAKYGLEFPAGTKMETPAWQEAMVGKETCPQCGKRVSVEELMNDGCPWCGWISARAKKAGAIPSGNGHRQEEIPSVEAR
jgi:ssDNA-binding Zn-finger/Zn-ribbon topoisomerase 1